MSNGDDVLDNWEELDEIGLNSTLEKIQAERINTKPAISDENIIKITPKPIITAIDTAIETADSNFYTSGALLTNSTVTTFSYTPTPPTMKILQRTASQEHNNKLLTTASNTTDITSNTTAAEMSEAITTKSPLDTMAASFEPVMMVLHKQDDEYQAANYEQPINNQTVKILRRPTQNLDMRNNGLKQPRQPIKTLQQREQEYAEARLRIMGAAKNPEDETALAENAATSEALNLKTSVTAVTTTTTTPTTPLSLTTNIGRTLTTYQTSMTTATQFIPTTNSFTPIVTHPYTPKMNTNVASFNLNPSPKISQSGLNLYNNYYYTQQLQHQQQQQQQQQPPQQQFYYHHQQQQQQQSSIATTPAVYSNRSQNLLPTNVTLPLVFQPQLHATPSSQPTHMTWSPIVGGSVSTPSLRHQHHDSILRTPRGPDGSHGFQMRR